MASGSPLRFGERVTRKHWNTDSFAEQCSYPNCNKAFTLVERRHHCRCCGNIFCEDHSAFKRPLADDATYRPDGEWVRVCLPCYAILPIPRDMTSSQASEEDQAMSRFERHMIADQRSEASGKRNDSSKNFKSVLRHMNGKTYTGEWRHVHRTDGSNSVFEMANGETIVGRWSTKKSGNSAIFMGQFLAKGSDQPVSQEHFLFCGQPFSVKWEHAVEDLDWGNIRASITALQEQREYHAQCLSANAFNTLRLSRERARSDVSDPVDYADIAISQQVHSQDAAQAPQPYSPLRHFLLYGPEATHPRPPSSPPPSTTGQDAAASQSVLSTPPRDSFSHITTPVAHRPAAMSTAGSNSHISAAGSEGRPAAPTQHLVEMTAEEAAQAQNTFCEVLQLVLNDTSHPLGRLVRHFSASMTTPPPQLSSFLSRTIRDLHLRMAVQDIHDFISALEKCLLETTRDLVAFPIREGFFLRLLHQVVLPQVYTKLFTLYRNKYRARDSQLDAKLRLLAHITPANCLNKPEFHIPDDPNPYIAAIDTMTQFPSAQCPMDKLRALVDTANAITRQIMTNAGVTSVEQIPSYGADVSWPLFQYVLIKAQLPYLYSELQFLLDFSSRRLIADNDSLSYRLMVFEATIDLIWVLDSEVDADGVLVPKRTAVGIDDLKSRLADIPLNSLTALND